MARLIELTFAVALMVAHASAGAQALIRLNPDTDIGTITGIWVNGVLAGTPGDLIELPLGLQKLRFDIGPYEVPASSTADKGTLESVVAGELAIKRDRCNVPVLDVGGAPTISLVKADGSAVNDARIVFARNGQTGRKSVCAQPVGLAPFQQAAIVSFSSDPPGAEIWLDGVNLQQTTNIQLSIPFQRFQSDQVFQPKEVLLKSAGRVNRNFQVLIDSRSISAKLETPEQWAMRLREESTDGGVRGPPQGLTVQ